MAREPLVLVGHVDRLEIVVNPGPSTDVRITIRERDDRRRVVLLSAVNSLHVAQVASNWTVTLQVVDIADRGMEGLRFHVSDPVGDGPGTISCLCAEVDVTEVRGS